MKNNKDSIKTIKEIKIDVKNAGPKKRTAAKDRLTPNELMEFVALFGILENEVVKRQIVSLVEHLVELQERIE